MKKNIISFILSVILIFTFNFKSNANNYLSLNKEQKINLQEKNYETISYNDKSNNFLWITNIFIAGLSQILMGDINRGLKFLYVELGLTALGVIVVLAFQPIASLFLAPSESMKGLALQVVLVYSIIILILSNNIVSIVDAINMNQELKKSNISIKIDGNSLILCNNIKF